MYNTVFPYNFWNKYNPLQPTAWDGDPVPADLPPPSSRYKEMYKQYGEDMKKSYREHTNSSVNQVRALSLFQWKRFILVFIIITIFFIYKLIQQVLSIQMILLLWLDKSGSKFGNTTILRPNFALNPNLALFKKNYALWFFKMAANFSKNIKFVCIKQYSWINQ